MTRPDPRDLTRALSAAALVLAVTSRGDLAVLGVVLVLADLAPATVVATAAAFTASAWRWGSTSLDALAGAQSVLGAAVTVGPGSAAIGSGLAGASILLALAASTDPIRLGAIGATVAALVAGPGSGDGTGLRVAVGVVAAALAWAVARLTEERPRGALAVEVAGMAAGVGALVAVTRHAPPWPPHMDVAGLGTGVAVAGAAGIAVLVASSAARAQWSAGWVRPRLRRPDPRDPAAPRGS